jgi:hypothetical protein
LNKLIYFLCFYLLLIKKLQVFEMRSYVIWASKAHFRKCLWNLASWRDWTWSTVESKVLRCLKSRKNIYNWTLLIFL